MTMLTTYVTGWRESADAILNLAHAMHPGDGAIVTDCPGWTVQDVIAHLAHLESVLCGESSDSGAADATELVASYTEEGVSQRRQRSLAEVTEELRAAIEIRSQQLSDLPDDPSLPAPVTPGGIDWSWDVLLRNRCVDMWVHEQDIRRALHRPGGLDTTAAHVTIMTFSFALPFVLGKRVKPAAGTVVRWDVSGEVPVDVAVRIGEDGRAHRLDAVTEPVTALSMSSETFALLAAGRQGADQVDVAIDGDHELAQAVLAKMAITP